MKPSQIENPIGIVSRAYNDETAITKIDRDDLEPLLTDVNRRLPSNLRVHALLLSASDVARVDRRIARFVGGVPLFCIELRSNSVVVQDLIGDVIISDRANLIGFVDAFGITMPTHQYLVMDGEYVSVTTYGVEETKPS